jgi:pyrroline-5-carboxylate reductase
MPNTPSLVGMGMNLVCDGAHVSDASRGRVEELLSILGKSLEVSDEPMNQMTIIAAVGPTYVLPIIYALAVAGTKMGLRDRDPFLVAAQMVYGSAGMVLETGKSGEELKEMIGLRTLKEEDARPIFEEAFDLLIESLGICRRN